MNFRTRGTQAPFSFAVLLAFALLAPFMSGSARAQAPDPASGVVKVKSAYSVPETAFERASEVIASITSTIR